MRLAATTLALALGAGTLLSSNGGPMGKVLELRSTPETYEHSLEHLTLVPHKERGENMKKWDVKPMKEAAHCGSKIQSGPYTLQHCTFSTEGTPTLVTTLESKERNFTVNEEEAKNFAAEVIVFNSPIKVQIYDWEANGFSKGDRLRIVLGSSNPGVNYTGGYDGGWKQTWDLSGCQEFGPMPSRTGNYDSVRTWFVLKGSDLDEKLKDYGPLLGTETGPRAEKVLGSLISMGRGRLIRRLKDDDNRKVYNNRLADYSKICSNIYK